jgi:hypothetical protein
MSAAVGSRATPPYYCVLIRDARVRVDAIWRCQMLKRSLARPAWRVLRQRVAADRRASRRFPTCQLALRRRRLRNADAVRQPLVGASPPWVPPLGNAAVRRLSLCAVGDGARSSL